MSRASSDRSDSPAYQQRNCNWIRASSFRTCMMVAFVTIPLVVVTVFFTTLFKFGNASDLETSVFDALYRFSQLDAPQHYFVDQFTGTSNGRPNGSTEVLESISNGIVTPDGTFQQGGRDLDWPQTSESCHMFSNISKLVIVSEDEFMNVGMLLVPYLSKENRGLARFFGYARPSAPYPGKRSALPDPEVDIDELDHQLFRRSELRDTCRHVKLSKKTKTKIVDKRDKRRNTEVLVTTFKNKRAPKNAKKLLIVGSPSRNPIRMKRVLSLGHEAFGKKNVKKYPTLLVTYKHLTGDDDMLPKFKEREGLKQLQIMYLPKEILEHLPSKEEQGVSKQQVSVSVMLWNWIRAEVGEKEPEEEEAKEEDSK